MDDKTLTDDEALRLRKFRNEYPEFAKQLDALAAEVERLKETNSRLNRRCQAAEKGVRENVEACRKAGVSLGRALANGGYRMMEEEIASLRDLVEQRDSLLREADGIIGDAYGSHYDARLSAADRCPWCKRAAAWRKKAQA